MARVLLVEDDEKLGRQVADGLKAAGFQTVWMTRWFRGSDARTRRPDGKGLALAIATESVRRLGLSLTFHRPAESGLRAEIRKGT